MLPQLQPQFDSLENLRKTLFNELENLDEKSLNFQPAPDAWSRLQVIHHLIIVEKGSLRYMRKKTRSFPLAKKLGIGSEIRSALFTISLRLPFRYKMPGKGLAPSEDDLLLSDLKQEWTEHRAEFEEFLGQFTPETLRFVVFKHPAAGYFTISQTLRFIEEHVNHHMKQLKRIHRKENSRNQN
jgi:uncharacterized damage-inducible protein DinB